MDNTLIVVCPCVLMLSIIIITYSLIDIYLTITCEHLNFYIIEVCRTNMLSACKRSIRYKVDAFAENIVSEYSVA